METPRQNVLQGCELWIIRSHFYGAGKTGGHFTLNGRFRPRFSQETTSRRNGRPSLAIRRSLDREEFSWDMETRLMQVADLCADDEARHFYQHCVFQFVLAGIRRNSMFMPNRSLAAWTWTCERIFLRIYLSFWLVACPKATQ